MPVKQLVIVLVLLAASIVFTVTTSDVRRSSEPGIKMVQFGQPFYPATLRNWKPFTPHLADTYQVTVPFLPAEIGRWRGQEVDMNPAERAILPPDTGFARRFYTNDKGEYVYCSLVLEGADVASIHRPQYCLQGQGWALQNAPNLAVPVGEGGAASVTISRLIGSQEMADPSGGGRIRQEMVFAYWFVGKDRVTPSHFWRILVTTTDRLFRNRNHRWAYFLLAVPVMPPAAGETIEEAQERSMEVLRGFVSEVFPSVCNVPL